MIIMHFFKNHTYEYGSKLKTSKTPDLSLSLILTIQKLGYSMTFYPYPYRYFRPKAATRMVP